MAHVLLGIGANIGDREAALQSVLDAMPGRFQAIRCSSVYDTPPWGVLDQPTFLNAVIAAETNLSAEQVLEWGQDVEQAAHRERYRHWGPRTLDVDVLTYDDVRSDDPYLTLPHPRIQDRAFVLVGIVELEPEFMVPGHGSARALLDALDQEGITVHSTLRLPA